MFGINAQFALSFTYLYNKNNYIFHKFDQQQDQFCSKHTHNLEYQLVLQQVLWQPVANTYDYISTKAGLAQMTSLICPSHCTPSFKQKTRWGVPLYRLSDHTPLLLPVVTYPGFSFPSIVHKDQVCRGQVQCSYGRVPGSKPLHHLHIVYLWWTKYNPCIH